LIKKNTELNSVARKVLLRKKAARRIIKTTFLGVGALVALCWSLFRFWDVPREDIAAVVLGGILLTFGLALLALLIVSGLYFLRRFRKTKSSFMNLSDLDE